MIEKQDKNHFWLILNVVEGRLINYFGISPEVAGLCVWGGGGENPILEKNITSLLLGLIKSKYFFPLGPDFYVV